MKSIYVKPEISVSAVETVSFIATSFLSIDGTISDGSADSRNRGEIDEEEDFWIEDETVYGNLW